MASSIRRGINNETIIGLGSMIGVSFGATGEVAIEALVVGTIATLATDLWLGLLQMFGVPPADWALVGRWVAWMPRGVFVHRPIAATPSIRGELAIGWCFHYVVGIVYAALYLAMIRLVLASGPTLISALLFALALLVVPWLVMQPALGLGFFAARTPHPNVARIISIPGMQLSAPVSISGPCRSACFEPSGEMDSKLDPRHLHGRLTPAS